MHEGAVPHHGACHVKLNKKNVALIICGFNTFQKRSNRHIGSFPIQKMAAHKKTYEKQTRKLYHLPPKKTSFKNCTPEKKNGKKSPWHTTFDPNLARVPTIPPSAPLVPTSYRSRSIR